MRTHASVRAVQVAAHPARQSGLWFLGLGILLGSLLLADLAQAQRVPTAYPENSLSQTWSKRLPQLRQTLESRNPNYQRWKRQRKKQLASDHTLPPIRKSRSSLHYGKLRQVIDHREPYLRWKEKEAEMTSEKKAGRSVQAVAKVQAQGLNYKNLRKVVLRYQVAKPPLHRTNESAIHRLETKPTRARTN